MNRVIHFEVHASDPQRAAKFYRDLFGWEIKEWVVPGVQIPEENRYWLVGTGPENERGIDGGLMIRQGEAPEDGQAVNAYVCTIDVPSIDAYVTKAKTAGGTLTVPKMPVKGMGWLAYCKDTEGNIFGMMQNDEHAE